MQFTVFTTTEFVDSITTSPLGYISHALLNIIVVEGFPKELDFLTETQIKELFEQFSDIGRLSVLYDSKVDADNPILCHSKIDRKGPTITFVQQNSVCKYFFFFLFNIF